ncbi:MAG: large conductance mechanosensitive channel protein MscL [Hornefia sp.]|nr:large conductance mechanosensitive channel protein MscL [Hornefia sp.]
MKKFFKEFKEFAMQGNVLDMAVGIIIGGAFTAIVTSLVNNILNPIIGLFTGNNLDSLTATFGQVTFKYGAFLSSVINFIIVALVIFIIIKSINKLSNMRKKEEEAAEEAPAEPAEEILLLREIRDSLKK